MKLKHLQFSKNRRSSYDEQNGHCMNLQCIQICECSHSFVREYQIPPSTPLHKHMCRHVIFFVTQSNWSDLKHGKV